MPGPNFMVIGAQKCGTSWLSEMIRQHPDVYAPIRKELHFFNLRRNYRRGMDWYQGQFSDYGGQKAIGEFTPNYLWICPNQQEVEERGVIDNIPQIVHRWYPDLKMIVCMRDPVKRAMSAHCHFMRSRTFPPTSRIMDVGYTNGIITMGYYYKQISEWLKYFPRENFLFLVYEEDVLRNKMATMRTVFRFLGVDESFVPERMDEKYNVRSGDLYLRMNYYFPSFTKKSFRVFPFLYSVNFPKIEWSDGEIRQLSKMYAEANSGLSGLINRSVPW